LLNAWCQAAEGKSVASFDCFDTLLWRGVNTPTDVFCEIAGTPAFKSRRFTAHHRIAAESQARRVRFEQGGVPEVTLTEIYQQLFPETRDPGTTSLCAAREQEIEASLCFISPAVIECMREAHRRGMAVIVVSDTYFNAGQLRRLLVAVFPELDYLIDSVFCSSDYRIGKAHGLWRYVLEELSESPDALLHVGDNPIADVSVPRKLGITSLLFERYCRTANQTRQRRECATRLMFEGVGDTQPVWTLYDGVAVPEETRSPHWSNTLGRDFLGPIVFAFAQCLHHEFDGTLPGEEAAPDRPRVKFGFLMRDAYLLQHAADIVAPTTAHPSLHISRQTAFSASFEDDDAILRFIKLSALEYRLSAAQCAACLMLNEEETARLTTAFAAKKHDARAVVSFFTTEMCQLIRARSTHFRQRMLDHIVAQTDVRPGDTLCLVDIGYHGTIQYLLRDVLRKHLQVNVIGRYLIYRDNLRLLGQASGLIDSSWVDQGLIRTLTQTGIAHIESLCAGPGGSVFDYTKAGKPRRKPVATPCPKWITESQQAALRFIEDLRAAAPSTVPALTTSRLKASALTNLASLLFFPSEPELSASRAMRSDVNIGGDVCYDVFDPRKGVGGLRRRGLLYLTGGGEFRSSTQFELRYAGVDQLALYMVSLRNGLPMTESTFSFRYVDIPVTFRFDQIAVRRTIRAHATYDGFYTAVFPLGLFGVQLAIGTIGRWIQIESVSSFPAEAYGHLSETDGPHLRYEGDDYRFHGIRRHEPSLLECEATAMMAFDPIPSGSSDYIRLAFRPVTQHEAVCLPDTGKAARSRHAMVQVLDTSEANGVLYSGSIVECEQMVDKKLHAAASVLEAARYSCI
jgi:FMN phosphatase YigB (HAD superfamily)